MKKLYGLIAIILFFAVCTLQATPYVIIRGPDGAQRRREGVAVTRRPNGDVLLTTADGQRLNFPADQVVRAEGAKPREYDEAQRLFDEGSYDEAIRQFSAIARRMRGLTWDIRALRQVAQAYMVKEEWDNAVETFDQIFTENPEMRQQEQLLWPYVDALEEMDGQETKIRELLTDVISKAQPTVAARAQLRRGDISARQGLYRDAVLDYLRTVVFYERVQELMPEAIYKTAIALSEMRDPRAQEWFSKLEEQYPQHEYARRARARRER